MEEKHFGPQISRLHVLVKHRIEHITSSSGLSSMQSHILVFLHYESAKREVFQKDLEEQFKIRRSSVSSVLTTMEKNGLIERITSEKDARLKKILITRKGEQVRLGIHQEIYAFDQQFRSVLNEEERRQFEGYVQRLSNFLEESDRNEQEVV